MNRITYLLIVLVLTISSFGFAQTQSEADEVEKKIDLLWDEGIELAKNNEYLQSFEKLQKARNLWIDFFELDVEYAYLLSYLGTSKYALKDYEKAITFFQNSLSIIKENKGVKNKDYLEVLVSLGKAYKSNDEIDNANRANEESLFIAKSLFGEEDTEYIKFLDNLIKVHYKNRDYNAAIPLLQEKLDVIKSNNKNSLTHLKSLKNLAFFYYKNNQFEFSIPRYKKSLSLTKSHHGNNSSESELILFYLAKSYYNLELYTDALPYFKESVKVTEALYGKKSDAHIKSLLRLGDIYLELEEHDLSLSFYKEGKSISKSLHGVESSLYFLFLNRLGDFYYKIDKLDLALPLYKEGKVIANALYGLESKHYNSSLIRLGNTYYGNGKYNLALPFYTESLRIAKLLFEENSIEHFEALDNLGSLYFELGDFNLAVPILEECLNVTEAIYGNQSEESIKIIGDLANAYYHIEAYEKALPLYKLHKQITQSKFGDQHIEYAYSLNNLANSYAGIGQNNEAKLLYQESLDIIERELGEQSEENIEWLTNLIYLHVSLKEFEQAQTLFDGLLKLKKESTNDDYEGYLKALSIQAYNYYTNKEYSLALPLYKKSLEISDTLYENNHADYLKSLFNLANVYTALKDYKNANPLYKKYCNIQISKKEVSMVFLSELFLAAHFLGGSEALSFYQYGINAAKVLKSKEKVKYCEAKIYFLHNEYSKAIPVYKEVIKDYNEELFNKYVYNRLIEELATMYFSNGNYVEALEVNNEILSIKEKEFGQNHKSYLLTKSTIGVLHRELGNYKQALKIFQEVELKYKNLVGENSKTYAKSLNNLAATHALNKNYKQAIELNKKSIEILNKFPKDDTYILSVTNLARMYVLDNEENMALELYNKILENSKDFDDVDKLFAIRGKASLLFRNADYVNALVLFQNYIKIHEATNQYKDSAYFDGILTLAILNQFIENYADAFDYLTIYKNYLDNQFITNFSFLTETEKKQFLEGKVNHFTHILENFNYQTKYKYSSKVEEALNICLAYKGALLNSTLFKNNSINTLNNDKLESILTLYQEKKEFVTQQQMLPDNKRVPNLYQKIDSLEILETELSRIYGSNTSLSYNFQQNWKSIPLKENEIAIEFSHFTDYSYDDKLTVKGRYVAYIYGKNWETPQVVDLFETSELKDYFTNFSSPNDLFAKRGSKGKSTKANISAVDSIYKLIWKPIEPYLNGSSKIYYSPDGLLHKIPFAALSNAENKLLISNYEMQQMGSTSFLINEEKFITPTDIALFGGIDFEYEKQTAKEKQTDTKPSWDYLPGTLKEIEQIQKLFKENKLSYISYSNRIATETIFKQQSGNSSKVIHIATHGFYLEDFQKNNSYRITLHEELGLAFEKDPLKRAGLILAGANYAWQQGSNPYEDEDGLLTAYEISNLDLSNTDMVVLSACETGLGDIDGSEGVYGLQRAFKMAGVDLIVMSLWEVPDIETSEFMSIFYTNWLNGQDVRIAFRNTQLTMAEQYKDNPEKWAAFVLFE